MQCKYNAKEKKKKNLLLIRKKKFLVPRCEFWREAVFKSTDCPRNVGDSATPLDKEDPISKFVQKKTKTMLHQFYFPFSAR